MSATPEEVARFFKDGFWDGRSYKNTDGKERMILFINRSLDHAISFLEGGRAGSCTIAEWYEWLGDKWRAGGKIAATATVVETIAKAKAVNYATGGLTTKPFDVPKDAKKWRSPKDKTNS